MNSRLRVRVTSSICLLAAIAASIVLRGCSPSDNAYRDFVSGGSFADGLSGYEFAEWDEVVRRGVSSLDDGQRGTVRITGRVKAGLIGAGKPWTLKIPVQSSPVIVPLPRYPKNAPEDLFSTLTPMSAGERGLSKESTIWIHDARFDDWRVPDTTTVDLEKIEFIAEKG